MGMLISAPKKEAIDFQALREEVLAKLDKRAEFESLGVRFIPDAKRGSDGWIQVHAAGRADENPSGSVNLQTGYYRDFTQDEKSISLFDLAIRTGVYSDYTLAFNAYLEKSGVEAKPIKYNTKGEFTEVSYEYFDPTGKLAYVVHRKMRRGGGKSFSQHRILPDGEVQYSIKGYTPYPYHLPEILEADSKEVILVHEGEKAADRAMNAGFLSTTHNGGSNNSGVWDQLAVYFKDRDLVLLPDNDGPGITMMPKIADTLSAVARRVRVLQLPRVPEKGDIVEFLDQCGGTIEELRMLIEATPTWKVGSKLHVSDAPEVHDAHLIVGEVSESNDDPDRLARVYLQRNHANTEHPTCAHWRGEFHTWDGFRWENKDTKEFRSRVDTSIKREFDRVAKASDKKEYPMHVTTTVSNNVLSAVTRQTMLYSNDVTQQPSWLGLKRQEDHNVNFLIPCRNGIVCLDMENHGYPKVIPNTPRLFSNYSLPFDYNLDAPTPELWLKFLREVWPNDEESIEMLQEWFGYMTIRDRRIQKILFMHGPTRSGKGTIINVLTEMVGPENVHAGDLGAIGERFGLDQVVNKPLITFNEAELGGMTNRGAIVNRLKNLSGGDVMTAERKNVRELWRGVPACRITFAANSLPSLSDKSLAFAKRFIFLKMTESFNDRIDPMLLDKLRKELPGILNWSIIGLYRLFDRGQFIQPRSGESLYEEFVGVSSNISGFIDEHLEITDPKQPGYLGKSDRALASDVYSRWVDYCKENGIQAVGTSNHLSRDLTSAISTMVKKDATIKNEKTGDTKTHKCYYGITLKPPTESPAF